MPDIENSEAIRHILETLLSISSRKTTQGHALLTMNGLITKLQGKYNFLKHVEIKDTRFVELDDPIGVMTDINSVKSDDVGRALYDIIKSMNDALGESAGHFFIKELRNNIGENYSTIIEEMGLDLGLMQLEFEVSEMTKKL
jgi:hypothetical protein